MIGLVVLVLVGIHVASTNSNSPPITADAAPTVVDSLPPPQTAPSVARPADPSWSATQFPSTTYPAPITAPENGFGIVACPNPVGLQAVSPADRKAAVQSLSADEIVTSVDFQRQTDRAWWANGPTPMEPVAPGTTLTAETLARSGLAHLGVETVGAQCGVETAADTFVVVSRPPGGGPALDTDYLFIKRGGAMLLWLTGA
jgi:hypothetical protein